MSSHIKLNLHVTLLRNKKKFSENLLLKQQPFLIWTVQTVTFSQLTQQNIH